MDPTSTGLLERIVELLSFFKGVTKPMWSAERKLTLLSGLTYGSAQTSAIEFGEPNRTRLPPIAQPKLRPLALVSKKNGHILTIDDRPKLVKTFSYFEGVQYIETIDKFNVDLLEIDQNDMKALLYSKERKEIPSSILQNRNSSQLVKFTKLVDILKLAQFFAYDQALVSLLCRQMCSIFPGGSIKKQALSEPMSSNLLKNDSWRAFIEQKDGLIW